ncbi:MAG: hypothetical protein H0V17_13510 [Deltaproteobacteria bacterium]|nr:hypothetical protein [Deltaproteobacteria bacterium]
MTISGCVGVRHTGGDTVTVRAFADGLETSQELPVEDVGRVSPMARFEAFAASRGGFRGDTAGERAAMR